MEFDEETLAAAEQRAAELGFPDVESFIRALLEHDASLPDAIARHKAMRKILEGGEGDHSAN